MKNKQAIEKFNYKAPKKNKNSIPVWQCYPASYKLGMSSLGYLSLFKELDLNPNVVCERIFTDTAKTQIMPQNVELIGFSFSFELDYLGILKTLKKYGLPLRSEKRKNEALIFGGGPVLSANPEPFADFFDFIILGDGENIFNEIIEKYSKVRNLPRKEKLQHLSQISGIYVPSLYDASYNPDGSIASFESKSSDIPSSLTKRTLKNFNECISSPIITENSFFSNTFLVEIGRGCSRKCRYCIASYLNIPARYPSYEKIINSIEDGLKLTDKIGLLGALIADHPDFDKICEYILERRKEKEFKISVSSLRADKISEPAVKTLVTCGQKNCTISIEAGSERLRNVINKKLNEKQIIESVNIAKKNGLKGLKIYGMLGLPTENQEDIEALIKLMKHLKNENKGFNLTLSVSSFIPKAQTPFQWAPRENFKIIKKKNELLRKELAKAGIKYKPTSPRWDFIQAVISRGDRRLSYLLEKTLSDNGTFDSFKRNYIELKKTGFSMPELCWYGERKINEKEKLPWDFIDSGVNKEILIKEYENAFK